MAESDQDSAALTAASLSAEIHVNKKLRSSIRWLVENAAELGPHESVDDYPFPADGRGPVAHHLTALRNAIVRQLRLNHLFIGESLIDELLYGIVRRRTEDPILELLTRLVDERILQPGYVLYPLHSFGMLMDSLAPDRTPTFREHLSRVYGISVCSQRRDVASVAKWLSDVHDWFGIDGELTVDILEHWTRSRAGWLVRNPLLAVKITEASGAYNENQPFILDRVHIATVFLGALAVRQPDSDNSGHRFTTRTLNNLSTRDICHYFVVSGGMEENGSLNSRPVVMDPDNMYLVELSDLPIDLDVAYWDSHINDSRELWFALNTLWAQSSIGRWGHGNGSPSVKAQVALNVFRSLDYFRRSLRANNWYAVSSLGTAFELLLTSYCQRGVKARLGRRVELLTGDAKQAAGVERLYTERSLSVHGGVTPLRDFPICDVQRTYLTCLEKVADGLDRLGRKDDDPLRTISGDEVRRQASMSVGAVLQCLRRRLH